MDPLWSTGPSVTLLRLDDAPTWVRADHISAVYAQAGMTVIALSGGQTITSGETVDALMDKIAKSFQEPPS